MGYDEESRTFARDFKEDHPDGQSVEEDIPEESVLNILQLLEGDVYEVVSISEKIDQYSMDWNVWYRNKS
jgi:hypothetical protein